MIVGRDQHLVPPDHNSHLRDHYYYNILAHYLEKLPNHYYQPLIVVDSVFERQSLQQMSMSLRILHCRLPLDMIREELAT